MAAQERGHNILINCIMIVVSAICLMPLILLIIVSFSSENSLVVNGYSFWPSEWSIAAYQYLFRSPTIYKAYGMSILVTAVGTVFALGVKGIFLLLGVLRMATMWGAVFADVGVAIIAILNAMRALKVPRKDT